MHRRAGLPIRLALNLDAPDGGEMGKDRSVGGTRDYAGAAPFLPVVTAVTFLIELELAIALGGRERGRDASKQRRMIAFEFEGVIPAFVDIDSPRIAVGPRSRRLTH
jgi:hypothetical protein